MEELKYIPISSLAELAYCPRNFYYQMVEGVEDENIYMLKGKLQDISRKERKKVWRKSGIRIRYVVEIIDLKKKGFKITLPLPPPIKGGEVEIIGLSKRFISPLHP